MPSVSQPEQDIAFQNIDNASLQRAIKAVLIWRDFDYSKNDCLKENPKVYKLRREPLGFNGVLGRLKVNW